MRLVGDEPLTAPFQDPRPRTSHPASYQLCLRLRPHQALVSTGKRQLQTAVPLENLRGALRVKEKTPVMETPMMGTPMMGTPVMGIPMMGTPVTRTGAANGSMCSC